MQIWAAQAADGGSNGHVCSACRGLRGVAVATAERRHAEQDLFDVLVIALFANCSGPLRQIAPILNSCLRKTISVLVCCAVLRVVACKSC